MQRDVRAKYDSGIAAAKRVIQATPDLKECQEQLWTIIDEVGTVLENGEIDLHGANSDPVGEAREATQLILINCFADVVSAANCLDQGIPPRQRSSFDPLLRTLVSRLR